VAREPIWPYGSSLESKSPFSRAGCRPLRRTVRIRRRGKKASPNSLEFTTAWASNGFFFENGRKTAVTGIVECNAHLTASRDRSEKFCSSTVGELCSTALKVLIASETRSRCKRVLADRSRDYMQHELRSAGSLLISGLHTWAGRSRRDISFGFDTL
jgi:hypothetical protein